MSTDPETPEEIMASLQKREEMFEQWAKSRDCVRRSEAKTEAANMVTKSAPTQRTNDMSADWQRYIAGEINRCDNHVIKLCMEVVGEVLGESLKKLRAEFKAELEAEVLKLRAEFLERELDRERGVKRLKVVPPDTGSMIA